MKLILAALISLFTSASALAQIQVNLEAKRTTYLLYEAVPVTVTLGNTSEYDLVLRTDGHHPWLSFLMTRVSDGNPVRADQTSDFEPVTIKPGESKSLTINLTPLHAFREVGQYKVRAVVELNGQQYLSAPYSFTVTNGQQIWTATKPYQGTEITYSLIRFTPHIESTFLYLRVEDTKENLVYANHKLGEVVAYNPPQSLFDASGLLHILHNQGQGTYHYVRIDPHGQIQAQMNYASFNQSTPMLRKTEDQSIMVQGGRAENEFTARERLSAAQNLLAREPVLPVFKK
jgi:hypothetical protein